LKEFVSERHTLFQQCSEKEALNVGYKFHISTLQGFSRGSVGLKVEQALFFKASASCSKILHGEKIFNTEHIHLGVIRVIWASVLCNLDQSREWL